MKSRENIWRLLRVGVVISLLLFLWLVSGKNEEKQDVINEEKQNTITAESYTDEAEPIRENELIALQEELESMLAETEGKWSVYVKNLDTEDEISINPQEMYAASLIKLFVMESSFAHMEELIENDSLYSGDENVSRETIAETLNAMITVSDNESYNEMVRLHSKDRSFTEGCIAVGEYLEEKDYRHTGIYHTLHPAYSAYEETEINGNNYTSVTDCASLLESIYRGECVSKESSEKMLNLLLQQQVVHKIPAGIPEGIPVANKTGETDEVQHDVAIVFGPKADYILCVMSSEITDMNVATEKIQEISAKVYKELEE